MHACRNMEENGSAAMLATKRSVDVVPGVNLREQDLSKILNCCTVVFVTIRFPILEGFYCDRRSKERI